MPNPVHSGAWLESMQHNGEGMNCLQYPRLSWTCLVTDSTGQNGNAGQNRPACLRPDFGSQCPEPKNEKALSRRNACPMRQQDGSMLHENAKNAESMA